MNLRHNAFVLLVLSVLLAIAGQWTAHGTVAHWWALPAALLLLGLAYERLITARAGLTLLIDTSPRWHLGRAEMARWRFSHVLRRSLLLSIAPRPPSGVDVATRLQQLQVPPGAGAWRDLKAMPRRLGRIQWPAQPVRIAGPLGLAWWSQRLSAGGGSQVVPELLDFCEQASGATSMGARRSRVAGAGAGSQVEQLREYRPGDPLRVIDWKATARRRILISREFAEEQRLDVIVAIDAGRSSRVYCGALDRLGHYVNVTARFAQHVTARDDRMGVVIFGDRPLASLPPARGTAAVSRIRALLGGIEAQSTDSSPFHAAARVRALVQQRSLVILLTDIENASSGGQLVAAVRLLRTRHLPFIVALSSLVPQALAQQQPRNWLDPYVALAAGLQARQRERSVQALRLFGAVAVVARPEELERVIFDNYEDFRRRRRI